MASVKNTVESIYTADTSNLVSNVNKAKKSTDDLEKSVASNMQKVGSNFQKAGAAATAFGVAGVLAINKFVSAAEAQLLAETKLETVARDRIGANEKQIQSLKDLASATQEVGVIGDEVLISGQQQLATFATQTDTIEQLTPAMADLLAQQKGVNATQEDATNIANLFGKAMNGQVGALSRVGISFSDAQEEVLKYGTETEKASILSEVIADNIGNVNEELAKTELGQLQQLKNTMGDLAEEIGFVLLPALVSFADIFRTSVLPSIEQIISFLQANPIIAKIIVGVTALLLVLGPLLIFIGSLITAVSTILPLFTALGSAIAFLFSPITLIIAGIVALIAILVLLEKEFGLLSKAWDLVVEGFNIGWEFVKSLFLQGYNLVKNYITLMIQVHILMYKQVINIFNELKSGAINIINTMRNTVVAIVNSLKNTVINIAVSMKNGFVAVVNSIYSPVVSIFSSIRDFAFGVVEDIVGFFSSIGDRIDSFIPDFSIPGITASSVNNILGTGNQLTPIGSATTTNNSTVNYTVNTSSTMTLTQIRRDQRFNTRHQQLNTRRLV